MRNINESFWAHINVKSLPGKLVIAFWRMLFAFLFKFKFPPQIMWHKFTNYRFIEHFNFANRLADEHTHTHTNKVLTIRAVIGRSLWRRSTLPVRHSQEPSLRSLLLQLATAAFSTSRSQLILQSFWRVAPSVSFVSAYTESTGGGIFYFFCIRWSFSRSVAFWRLTRFACYVS